MKNMRWILWLMILAMLMGIFAFPAVAEAEERLIFSIVAADDEAAWVHTDKGLMRFSVEGAVMEGPLYPGADCYAVGPDGHVYYSVGGDIIEMDETGTEIDRWKTPIDGFEKILANGKYILLMGDKEYGAIDADAHMLRSGIVDGVTDIGFYNEESFLLLQGTLLVRLECSTMEDVDLHHLGSYDGIAYSDEEGPHYLHAQNHIDVLDGFGGNIENYANLSADGRMDDICVTEKNVWYIEDFALKNFPRNDFEKQAEKTLYIVGQITANGDERLNRAIEIFEEQYPEYKVQIRTQGVGAPLKTALMANSEGYDLLMINSMSSALFKNSGLLAELSENAVICENLESYVDMPFLWEEDGRLYGVPMFVNPYTLMTRQAFWDQIAGEIPENWIWEDFAALADEAEEMGLCLVNEDANWNILLQQYNSVYCDFIAGEADYSNDTFRSLVSMWKNLTDAGAVCAPAERDALLIYDVASASQVMNAGRYVYLGMPSLNGENVIPVYMSALYANRYSQNADAAIRFLEIYSSVEAQRAYRSGLNGMLLEDMAVYDEYPIWEQFGFYPEEEVELWRNLLSSGRLLERELEQVKRVQELVTDLLGDRLTVDEFVSEMQETADLMIGE